MTIACVVFTFSFSDDVDRSGQVRACKVISKSRFVQAKQKQIYFDGMRTEIEIMKKVSEKTPTNIIRFFEVCVACFCRPLLVQGARHPLQWSRFSSHSLFRFLRVFRRPVAVL